MFNQKLEYGLLGESKISSWLRSRGRWVLPAYEIEQDDKGPRLWSPKKRYITPDLLVFSADGTSWIEAKHKTVFTWHRKSGKWTTGIDQHHWKAYLDLARDWVWSLWLLFLHEQSEPDDRDRPYCPGKCPTGLFGNSIESLAANVNHTSPNWGSHGMIYWAYDSLKKLATVDEVNRAHNAMVGRKKSKST